MTAPKIDQVVEPTTIETVREAQLWVHRISCEQVSGNKLICSLNSAPAVMVSFLLDRNVTHPTRPSPPVPSPAQESTFGRVYFGGLRLDLSSPDAVFEIGKVLALNSRSSGLHLRLRHTSTTPYLTQTLHG